MIRLLATLVLLLTACTGAPGEPPGTTGAITFVDGLDTSAGRQVARLVARWNDAHPLEPVTFKEMAQSTDVHRAQLMARSQDLAGADDPRHDGQCYDVMNLDSVWTAAFAGSGYLEPLPADAFGADRMLPQAVESARRDERSLWAVPWRVDAGLLYYRKDVLEQEDEAPPRTWAELERLASELGPAHGLAGYVGQFAEYEGVTVNALEAVWAHGGDPLRPDGPGAKQGVDVLARGFAEGWIPREALDFREEESRVAFQSGKALFMRNWPYVQPRLAGPDSDVADRWGVTRLPGPSALGGWNLAVSRCSANQETARAFIRFLTGADTQRALFDAAGWAPSLEALYRDEVPALLAEAVRAAKSRPTSAHYDELTSVMRQRFRLALQNPNAVDSLLDGLADEVRRVEEGR
ncbi:extracellular solute-binding protein [Saccharothrix longispora]|uniref:Multiple sugar transport system substrate-binding protein n=1 Tax=Saccharothrix longispora TaxID=33920 RepID=A0ABU1Q7G0_9PSEU|nr:extracellular solute-binding protein [Saccharothrix longispora]MDR6598811.1 multiple sugar transport system substrate-binding protein [Saccharothrix longispora]